MNPSFHFSSLIPVGLAVENVSSDAEIVLISARAEAATTACPLCGAASSRIHSRYIRSVSDLPYAGRGIRLRLAARRFRCDEPHCQQRIFAERFDDDILRARSRRTTRLDSIVH